MLRHRSSGVRPVVFAILASIPGPTSATSWHANTTSGQSGRSRARCKPPVAAGWDGYDVGAACLDLGLEVPHGGVVVGCAHAACVLQRRPRS